ncbi:37S ribosomal protein S12 [Penicillium verhagenii]|uniref:37S ribosomal protein S12 n=1 Tax=Penicillium verhagenii TaxID=1562060 RepID=UPI002545BAB6|nr:37S ribosomal protein S12 [Penicillium verhagenii]KAJ5918950.1 37S ribosomal protein S12 [Penicillium verhagenii]
MPRPGLWPSGAADSCPAPSYFINTPPHLSATSTNASRAQPALTSRFNFQPVFRTQTALTCHHCRLILQLPDYPGDIQPSPLGADHPSLKGVCLKTGVTKPKKPNSGERKFARVRLSTGKVISAIIPGEGMYLKMPDIGDTYFQQHSVVQVRGGRVAGLSWCEVPLGSGGAMDLGGVGSRNSSCFKYGTKKPKSN